MYVRVREGGGGGERRSESDRVMKREIAINTYSFLHLFSRFCITLFIVKHFWLPILECKHSRNPPLFLLLPYNCCMHFRFEKEKENLLVSSVVCPPFRLFLASPEKRLFFRDWTKLLEKRNSKLQALVYDILPATTAVFSYAIGSRKLSANEQFFVDAQTVVSLLQTTQIKQSVSCIATNKVYSSENKTTIVPIEMELFLTRGGCVSCLRACFGVRLLLQSLLVPEPFGECWPRRWTAARR